MQGNDPNVVGIDWGALKAYYSKGWDVRLHVERDGYIKDHRDDFIVWIHLAKDGKFCALLDVVTKLQALGRVLRAYDTHMHGMDKGGLGLGGIYAIAQAAMEEADVDELIIEGGTRSSGARPGHDPGEFRFRRRRGSQAQS